MSAVRPTSGVDRKLSGSVRAKCALLIGLLVSLAGCQSIVRRGQSPDDPGLKMKADLKDTRYVGSVAMPYGMGQTKVEGIGLATRLRGTGSNPQPGARRQHLESEMMSHGVEETDKLLAGTDNSLVLVKGFIPAGARLGDTFDLYVITPPKSDTSSLAHGYLMPTRMRPMALLGNSVREGHVMGSGRGPLVINEIFNPRATELGNVQAVIPGGGVVGEPIPVGLAIQKDSHSIKTAAAIMSAINDRFSTREGSSLVPVANATSDRIVELKVPHTYRFNLKRYLNVIRNVAFAESASARFDRMQAIEAQLNDPDLAELAALRLEAIGKDAIPGLRRALRSDEQLVSFQAAQTLTYLGETDGLEVLESTALDQPALRWAALTALATCQHSQAEHALLRLTDADSAETRYGALQALLRRSPDDPVYQGERIADNFFLVHLASEGRPLLHLARRNRPELVVFGAESCRTNTNLLYVESGLTVKAKDADQVEIIRFLTDGQEASFVCSHRIDDLARTLAKAGAYYPTLIRLLKNAKDTDALTCDLVIDATPDPDRTYNRTTQATAQAGQKRR